MKNKKTFHQEKEPELSYFGVQAYWGISKPHMGGLRATQELIDLCHIDGDKYVLDVGCGVGITACYMAKKYECKVVGVDVSEPMISRARERAKKEYVEDRVEFRTADTQALSQAFENNVFDIVMGESVIAFLENKQKGINECMRVAKPDGYIGLNEATWLKRPPAEFVDYINRVAGAEFETSNNWRKLLRDSGLEDMEVRTYKFNAINQLMDEIRYIGLSDFLKGLGKFLSLLVRSPGFWRYLKESWPSKSVFKNYYKYLGYGLYVGRKR